LSTHDIAPDVAPGVESGDWRTLLEWKAADRGVYIRRHPTSGRWTLAIRQSPASTLLVYSGHYQNLNAALKHAEQIINAST
jgi:hypothetical protein